MASMPVIELPSTWGTDTAVQLAPPFDVSITEFAPTAKQSEEEEPARQLTASNASVPDGTAPCSQDVPPLRVT